jgi:S-adenosylmethionine:tRNA ribosyltransferase-isomerase
VLTSELDYALPDELIAQEPLPERDAARLLVLDSDGAGGSRFEDRSVRELPELLPEGALLVLNDTQVMKARVFGERATGGRVELLFLDPDPVEPRRWQVLLRSNKSVPVGTRVRVADVELEVGERTSQGTRWVNSPVSVKELLEVHGHVPLPPYVRRPDDARDRQSYQTVFARHWGSAAAPTAGLHLTRAALEAIAARGIEIGFVTLHVGAGTFRPVSAANLAEHAMHTEHYAISAELAEQVARARARGAKVVAVGTTVVRALESAALASTSRGGSSVYAGEHTTDLLISPGFQFRVVDALMTNFHAPKSTLLALVFAFAGQKLVREAYQHAIEQRYRFLSYGDAMWIPTRSN